MRATGVILFRLIPPRVVEVTGLKLRSNLALALRINMCLYLIYV